MSTDGIKEQHLFHSGRPNNDNTVTTFMCFPKYAVETVVRGQKNLELVSVVLSHYEAGQSHCNDRYPNDRNYRNGSISQVSQAPPISMTLLKA